MRRHRIVGALVALALLLAGCAAAAAPTESPQSPSPSPSPSPAAGRADVTGTMHCTGAAGIFDCTITASDPRVDGTTAHLAFSYKDMPDGSLSLWATHALTNQGGTWACKTAGLNAPGGDPAVYDTACQGQGPYIGLAWTFHLIGMIGAGTDFTLTGTIERLPAS